MMIHKCVKGMLAVFCMSMFLTGCSAQSAEGLEGTLAAENGEIEPEAAGEAESDGASAPESGETAPESRETVPEGRETAPETSAQEAYDETEDGKGGDRADAAWEAHADMGPVLVENPGTGFYLAREPETEQAHTLKLEQISEKENAVTDEENWFAENELEAPFYKIPGFWGDEEAVPEGIPDMLEGRPLTQVGFDASYLYCVYGEKYYSGYLLGLYDRETCMPLLSLDFSQYCLKDASSDAYQWIRWARAEEGMLYVSLSHNTYAETAPDHAYLVAIDLTDMSVLWKTETLVSNARNFEIIGNEIVCGYGFTAEDDFLYRIDRDTGRILEQLPLKTMADYIIRKDDKLFVRTYHTDYVFQIVNY